MTVVCQCCDNLSQSEQRFVDLYRFLELYRILRRVSTCGVRLTLAACQIDKLQLADRLRCCIIPRQVFLLHDQRKDAVRSRGGLIHVVRSHHLILQTFPEVLESVFGR